MATTNFGKVQKSPNANTTTGKQGTPKNVKKLLEDHYDKEGKHQIYKPWLQYLGLLLATIYNVEQVFSFDQLQYMLYKAAATKDGKLHAYTIVML